MSFLRKYIFGQESIHAEEAAAAAVKSAASSGKVHINERQVQMAPPMIPPRKSTKNLVDNCLDSTWFARQGVTQNAIQNVV